MLGGRTKFDEHFFRVTARDRAGKLLFETFQELSMWQVKPAVLNCGVLLFASFWLASSHVPGLADGTVADPQGVAVAGQSASSGQTEVTSQAQASTGPSPRSGESAAKSAAGAPVSYLRAIRPILSDNCYACHGPDAENREAGLRLDDRDSAFGEADSGERAIVPGDSANSELFHRITSHDPDAKMPPADSNKSLDAQQIERLRQWIDQGASWQTHWAFTAPVRPEIPTVSDPTWPANPIDFFILARLDREHLKPSAEADKETLLRPVSYTHLRAHET